MCGIAFLLDSSLDASDRRIRMHAALRSMLHRGPDAQGIIESDDWIVGHRRLSIIDLSASRQPMQSPNGRYTLSYNGELYNFRELRKLLENRWSFITQGDTEVVLAGLILEGPDFLKQMEGMWALALWDQHKRVLLLARDRFGEKPLYWRLRSDSIACASELPTLHQLSPNDWHVDPDSNADFLRYGYCLPGTTFYQDVCEVLPGHWLLWHPNKPANSTPYWQAPEINTSADSHIRLQERLRSALTAAVRKQLMADVDVGAFLSGGIDSSLVVALMSEASDTHIKTFSIGFTEAGFDERTYARLVARRYETDHYEEVLDHCSPDDLVRLIFKHIGQPFADSSLLPTALVSQTAAKHLRVVLSGDGADELFGGYQRYLARTLLRWYLALPARLRRHAERYLRGIPEPLTHHSHSLIKKAHLFIDLVNRRDSENPYIAPLMYDHKDFSSLAPDLARLGHISPLMPVDPSDEIGVLLRRDVTIYLPQDILTKVDRAAMAHSIEARAPFLDRTVAELALSLPSSHHHRGLKGKRLLRETFADLLPKAIWSRRKQGFAVPVHRWFRNGLQKQLRDLLEANRHLPISSAFTHQLIAEHEKGHRDHGYRLWNLYIYLLWQSNNFTPSHQPHVP